MAEVFTLVNSCMLGLGRLTLDIVIAVFLSKSQWVLLLQIPANPRPDALDDAVSEVFSTLNETRVDATVLSLWLAQVRIALSEFI